MRRLALAIFGGGLLAWASLAWAWPLWSSPHALPIWPLAGLLAGLALGWKRPPRQSGLAWVWRPLLFGLGFVALAALLGWLVLGWLGLRLADALSNWLAPAGSRTVGVLIASGRPDFGQIAAWLGLSWLIGLPFAVVQPRLRPAR